MSRLELKVAIHGYDATLSLASYPGLSIQEKEKGS
jgi:hypothetical protein